MNIPNLPSNWQMVDKNGVMATPWQQFFSQLLISLNTGLSNEGIILPQQTAANIALLIGTQSIGALIYDSTNNLAKVNLNGTFKTITTS